jgi:hypothetical protein
MLLSIRGTKVTDSDQKEVVRVLEKQGYTRVKIVDTQFVPHASKSSPLCYFSVVNAEATNSAGEDVEIQVYSVFPFKGEVRIKLK